MKWSKWALLAPVVLVFHSCADSGRQPLAPSGVDSSVVAATATLDWSCFRSAQVLEGWSFTTTGVSCPATTASTVGVGVGLVSVAPTNLRANVTGTTVRLDWNMAPDGVSSFLVEAGSAPGLANLATLNTGNNAPSLVVTNVPSGAYHVRVRGVGPDGVPGPPSGDVLVQVVGSTGNLPSAPSQLTRQVSGNQVVLTWAAPPEPVSTYIIEAGSSAGLSNIIVFDTLNAGTALSVTAPNGLYFVRVRARNGGGLSQPSNEVPVGVNVPEPSTETPPPPPPPPPTGGTPPSGGPSTPPCTYSAPASVEIGPLGGPLDVPVTTSAASCAWTATTSGFLAVVTGSGTGTGNAKFDAAINEATSPRSGSVRIAWSDGSATVAVTQRAASAKQPVSTAPVPVTEVTSPDGQVEPVKGDRPAAGTGPVAGVGVASQVANQVTLNITASKAVNSAAISFDVPASGSTSTSAALSNSFYAVVLTQPKSSFQVTLNVNPGPGFTVQVAVSDNGGSSFGNYASTQVTQPPCTYSIPTTAFNNVAASGGFVDVTVTTQPGCTWTAQVTDPASTGFVTVGSSGASDKARFNLSANAGDARTGIARIQWGSGGQNINIGQLSGCTYAVSPQKHAATWDGGTFFVTMTTGPTCSWTAADVSPAPFMTVTPPSGTGSTDNISVRVATNNVSTPTGRTGTLRFSGNGVTRDVVVTQPVAPCYYFWDPRSINNVSSTGGRFDVRITVQATGTPASNCFWSVSSPDSFIVVDPNSSGTGAAPGSVPVQVQPNTGFSRKGVIRINVGGGTFFEIPVTQF